MSDSLEHARALLPDVELEDAGRLPGSDRTEVHRAVARRSDQPESTVIVKRYHSAGEGWAREAAALSVLPDRSPAPRLLAESPQPPLVIISDAGTGPSVADALLGSYPGVALDAVLRWAAAVADLHRASLDLRPSFRAALDARAGDLPLADHVTGVGVDDAARAIADIAANLGVPLRSAALDEFRGLSRRLGADGAAALSPADTCPDNNVITERGFVLVDFEGAQWRHIVWDVAYLRVPWPTCWCSWRVPVEVADQAVERYRQGLADDVPYVGSDQFDRDVAAAAAGWALMSTTWFIGNALADEAPAVNADKPTPARRAMILHRLHVAAHTGELPDLAVFAGDLRAALVHLWGEVPLAFAPAFERGGVADRHPTEAQ